jgi:hypothetical protein
VRPQFGQKSATNIMAIIRTSDGIVDTDLQPLRRHLRLLDIELAQINSQIAASRDPESDGLCDAGEYFVGHGFVAIQRYLTATRCALGISISDAFNVPPMVREELSFAAALNAGANYWKHMEEWIETLGQSDEVELKGSALKTIQRIEAVTPWEEYTCANLLALLLDGQPLELSYLVPAISEWRDNLLAAVENK